MAASFYLRCRNLILASIVQVKCNTSGVKEVYINQYRSGTFHANMKHAFQIPDTTFLNLTSSGSGRHGRITN